MKLLDTWQIHTSHAHAQGILFYWMHGKFTGMHRKFTGLHGKFTVCMAVASARIIRVHILHGANSWSVKKNPRFLANQIAGILRPIVFKQSLYKILH